MYDDKSFSADVIQHWGTLSEELVDHDGLLHPQMAALGRLCLNRTEACHSVFAFLSRVLQKEDTVDEIENAVAISFLEWPALEELGQFAPLPDNIAEVVRKQWERGGNF